MFSTQQPLNSTKKTHDKVMSTLEDQTRVNCRVSKICSSQRQGSFKQTFQRRSAQHFSTKFRDTIRNLMRKKRVIDKFRSFCTERLSRRFSLTDHKGARSPKSGKRTLTIKYMEDDQRRHSHKLHRSSSEESGAVNSDQQRRNISDQLSLTNLQDGQFFGEVPLNSASTGCVTVHIWNNKLDIFLAAVQTRRSSRHRKRDSSSSMCYWGTIDLPIYVDPRKLSLNLETDRIRIQGPMKGYTQKRISFSSVDIGGHLAVPAGNTTKMFSASDSNLNLRR